MKNNHYIVIDPTKSEKDCIIGIFYSSSKVKVYEKLEEIQKRKIKKKEYIIEIIKLKLKNNG
jgi:hypothetical protein